MENIKRIFWNYKILIMYRCGSYAFNTSSRQSDEDYIVVLDGYNGVGHIGEDNKEYWIFGLEHFKQKMEFSPHLDKYYQIYNDEIFAFPNSIIYMDESIKPLIDKYINEFPSKVNLWLTKVIEYYQKPISIKDITKRCYHLLRIQDEVINFKNTGSFSLYLSDETKEKIRLFKLSYDKSLYQKEIIEAFNYLKKEVEEN